MYKKNILGSVLGILGAIGGAITAIISIGKFIKMRIARKKSN